MKQKLNTLFRYITSCIRRKPDFLIIGTQKGGTSSLFHYLEQHPELKLSSRKEVHYYNVHYHKGKLWYRSFFPLRFSCKLTGESTPDYLFHHDIPAKVAKDVPNVKLVVMLRDPISRAFSHFNMQRRKGAEQCDTFEEAIDYPLLVTQKNSYLCRGLYAEQISAWMELFDANQFLFIRSEDFFQAPKQELNRVYEFLGIQKYYPTDLSPHNTGIYDSLSLDTRETLTRYYSKSNQEVCALLGENFTWHSTEQERQ